MGWKITSTEPLTSETGIPVTSFDEVSVAETEPVVQISAQYGVEDDLNIVEVGSGNHFIADSLYTVSSGTDAISTASLNAKKQASYKPGQGIIARLTALFDTPQPNSLQAAGLITSEDSLAFGYLGEEFGIIRAFGGAVEAQELTLTTPASGAEVATVTVDGIGYPVNLTAATVQVNCWEIADQLTGVVPNHLITSNDDTVYIMSVVPESKGVYSFSSSTAAGSFVQEVAGVSPTIELIAQADWNVTTAPFLNPQAGNVYTIKFSYLGFSGVEFYVKDPETNRALLVHVIKYGNNNSVPIVRNPTFRAGWVVRNFGNTTDIKLSGASAMVANEGRIVNDNQSRSLENINITIGQTPNNLITLRNRSHFGNIINRASIQPFLLSFATDDTRGALFQIISGGDFGGNMNFQYLDKTNSITEYAFDTVPVTGGRVVASFSVTRESPLTLFSNDFKTIINPNEYFSIVASVKAGAAEEMDASITFIEDL